MAKIIGLADCNNFYVSCERVFNPSLIGKPVIVLSNNDGSAIARSQEAKDLGIKMGQNVYSIKDLIEKEGVITLSSNYTLYADMSERVVKAIQRHVPIVEIYSIDELFLDLDHINKNSLVETLLLIKEDVFMLTGIPISIGAGRTKTLAKIANKRAKTSSGVYIEFLEEEFLSQFPLFDVWGIGLKSEQKLRKIGCTTISDFLSIPDNWISKNLTISGLRTQKELMGIQCYKLEKDFKKKRSISTSRTFGWQTSDFFEVQKAIYTYLEKCVQKLKSDSLVAGQFILNLSNDKHRNEIYYDKNVSCRIPIRTNSLETIWSHVQSVLISIYDPTINYRKAGITLSDLCEEGYEQVSLFLEKKKSSTVKEPIGKNWIMRRDFLTKRYTTSWDELPEVNSVIKKE
jgi:DNA polymerase V